MGMPAARASDMHVCPMVTAIVPHVGGPILPPCCPTVLTGKLPQARVTDMATCVGPPDMIVKSDPYTMPANISQLVVMRLLIRNGFSRDMADMLLEDIRRSIAHLQKHSLARPLTPAEGTTFTHHALPKEKLPV